MSEKYRIDWVRPVLADLRDVLKKSGADDVADDLNAVLARHADRFATPANDDASMSQTATTIPFRRRYPRI